jgi:hypothetical protein
MSADVATTLRIDPAVKAAAETAARAQGISFTELVERSLKSYTTPVCPTCGRSSEPNVVAPGFSAALDEFIEEAVRVQSSRPLVILTAEKGEQVVYWAGIDLASRQQETLANKGVLMMKLWFDASGRKTYPLPIPRGLIIGWRLDSEGTWFENFLVQGYQNGNLRVRHRLEAVMNTPPRRGR